MALPKQQHIELPLLESISKARGSIKPSEAYKALAAHFKLAKGDLEQTLSSGGNKFTNLVQWARQSLVEKGEVDKSERGLWKITDKGRQRLALHVTTLPPLPPVPPPPGNLEGELLSTLKKLSPKGFQDFVVKTLLPSLGMTDVTVRQFAKDGGIDGEGQLDVTEETTIAGLKQTRSRTVKCSIQVKRWEATISRPQIQEFRGASSADFERGLYVTTSDFSKDAQQEAMKTAPLITTIDGRTLAGLLIEKNLGVKEITVKVVDQDFFSRFQG